MPVLSPRRDYPPCRVPSNKTQGEGRAEHMALRRQSPKDLGQAVSLGEIQRNLKGSCKLQTQTAGCAQSSFTSCRSRSAQQGPPSWGDTVPGPWGGYGGSTKPRCAACGCRHCYEMPIYRPRLHLLGSESPKVRPRNLFLTQTSPPRPSHFNAARLVVGASQLGPGPPCLQSVCQIRQPHFFRNPTCIHLHR